MQSVGHARPAASQSTVGTWFVRFGGLVQPSTHTTVPVRSYLPLGVLVGQPG